MDDTKGNTNLDKRLFSEANIALNPQVIPEDADAYFIILKDQIEKFINAGQYKWVLKAFKVLESEAAADRSSDLAARTLQYYHSPSFISLLIDSFGITGREQREEVLLLCEYFDEKIIPPLMDALNEEESHSNRRFIISLIIHFGDKAIHEVIKRLNDSRWYVKRNMLYILYECGSRDTLLKARPYCDHKHPKVSSEAVKCLLKAEDEYAVQMLHRYLRSKSRDIVMRAVSLSGAFRVKEVAPELIQILKKNTMMCKDINDKLNIVRAICQTGDPDALEMLKEVLSSNTRLFKGSFEKLKKEIYGIVKNYSTREAKDLLDYCENPECGKRKTEEEKPLAGLRKKLTLETFGEYSKKKIWFYMSVLFYMAVLMVIAVTLVVMSFIFLGNNNRVLQHIEERLTLSGNAAPGTSLVDKDEKYIVKAESDEDIESANKLVENIKADDQYVSRKNITIQAGSFTEIEHVQKRFDLMVDVLNEEELDLLRIEKVGKFYSVRLGNFENYAIAEKFLQEIKQRLPEAIILKANMKNERILKLYE
jgi:HEAT repeat protein